MLHYGHNIRRRQGEHDIHPDSINEQAHEEDGQPPSLVGDVGGGEAGDEHGGGDEREGVGRWVEAVFGVPHSTALTVVADNDVVGEAAGERGTDCQRLNV